MRLQAEEEFETCVDRQKKSLERPLSPIKATSRNLCASTTSRLGRNYDVQVGFLTLHQASGHDVNNKN